MSLLETAMATWKRQRAVLENACASPEAVASVEDALAQLPVDVGKDMLSQLIKVVLSQSLGNTSLGAFFWHAVAGCMRCGGG